MANTAIRVACSVSLVAIVACSAVSSQKDDQIGEIGADDGIDVVTQQVDTDEGIGEENPDRIILFVGDGMGLASVTASSYAAGRPLSMLGMDEFGMMATHEYEFVTTDSAASATAMATGEKTHFNGVSVTPSTGPEQEEDPQHQLRNLTDAADEAGWSTGLIATVRINHATPAPFAAHRHDRNEYEDIALDMSRSGVDVLLGAGSQYFRDREDGRDLLEQMSDDGYTIAEDAHEVRDCAQRVSRLVGLMHPRDMPWADEDEREMELDEMVDRGLEVLDRGDPEGVFLMVEGAKIDWAGHRMDGRRVVSETRDMDRAVQRALEYARGRDDTVVVVTSDHETGAMDVIDGRVADRYLDGLGEEDEQAVARTIPEGLSDRRADELAGPFARLRPRRGDFGPQGDDQEVVTSFGFLSAASRAQWDGSGRFSAVHTPQLVPVFAEGPGARRAASVRDNADLGRLLMSWVDGDDPQIQEAGTGGAAGEQGDAHNVVLVVADGFGMSSLTASYYHHGVPSMLRMNRAGAVATHSADRLVNEPPGAATALATGARTEATALGMERQHSDQGPLQPRANAMDQAVGSGKNTGIVSTSSLTDPVAAAFFARQREYGDREEIAEQFVSFHEEIGGVDFAAGGGEDFDQDHRQRLESAGVELADGWQSDGDPSGASHHLFDGDEASSPATLQEMTARAVDSLSEGDEGFFLVVDASEIGEVKEQFDNGSQLMESLGQLDETVEQLVDYARRSEDTLVVVTSLRDHTMSVLDNHYGFHRGNCGAVARCGGDVELRWLDVATDQIRHGEGLERDEMQGEYAPPRIALQYTWAAHQAQLERGGYTAPYSANFVPLFAEGPSAGEFSGFVDQPDIGRWLVDWAR